jgi:hypothetical protein
MQVPSIYPEVGRVTNTNRVPHSIVHEESDDSSGIEDSHIDSGVNWVA